MHDIDEIFIKFDSVLIAVAHGHTANGVPADAHVCDQGDDPDGHCVLVRYLGGGVR